MQMGKRNELHIIRMEQLYPGIWFLGRMILGNSTRNRIQFILFIFKVYKPWSLESNVLTTGDWQNATGNQRAG